VRSAPLLRLDTAVTVTAGQQGQAPIAPAIDDVIRAGHPRGASRGQTRAPRRRRSPHLDGRVGPPARRSTSRAPVAASALVTAPADRSASSRRPVRNQRARCYGHARTNDRVSERTKRPVPCVTSSASMNTPLPASHGEQLGDAGCVRHRAVDIARRPPSKARRYAPSDDRSCPVKPATYS
jgi:hypothetical protein